MRTQSNTERVSALYDQLLATELKHKKEAMYPIHKVLKFADKNISDIYQWIHHYIGFPNTGKILDAGCGVGWGSAFIAKQTHAAVVGISVSQDEISQAKHFHGIQFCTSTDQVSFLCQSFDDVPTKEYSFVVAVESLKHSKNIQHSLGKLIQSLEPGGTLVVVEDTLQNKAPEEKLMSFKADWQLTEVLEQKHMEPSSLNQFENIFEYQQHDFTSMMQIPSPALLELKRMFVSCLLKFKPSHMGWQAFRGGFTLDQLYASKHMKYLAHVYKRGL
ncbi:class I SAM-dependent methyltransferase [Agaribacter flavus]|uniref:Class I SAM-dependent methyltransferase n=1 Tax=Agaribacter flavus TaxID=1902781 RepID=A0ABV7FPT3_9ALTE